MTTGIHGRWEPGIGDPTMIGWITVVAYGVAMALCYRCYRKMPPGKERRFWLGMTLVMTFLGINKQLDLQTWLTEFGRDMALEYGWYERRRMVQALFIGWLILLAVVSLQRLAVWLKQLSRYARRAATGLVLLTLFVVIRATSFHHVDRMLGISLDGLRVNVILELGGVGVIVFAALACLSAPLTRLSNEAKGKRVSEKPPEH